MTHESRPTDSLSAAEARRFLAIRHLLAPPRSLPAEPGSILAVIDRLGSLQFDPLEVAGRNHDLVLQARVSGYRRSLTDALLYDRRLLFEAYNKGLSILPTRELPWYRLTWDRAHVRHAADTFPEHGDAVEAILARIRAEGPLSSLDFEREHAIDWYWGPTSRVRAMLEALAESGILGIARRDGNRRFYDLVERLFPGDLLAERIPAREQFRHKLLSRYRAHGLLGRTGSAEIWLGTGTAAPNAERGLPGRLALHADLVERGELVPVEVAGIRGLRYVIADELPLLVQARREIATESAPGKAAAGTTPGGAAPGGVAPAVTFLAPLDPLVWDRDMLRSLYGFDYVWEVYVPAAKRRWGYYVLPILFGDRLVGRIEPRIDRAARSVRILGTWWEHGFDPAGEPGFAAAMAAALRDYREFAGAQRVALPRGGPSRELWRQVRVAVAEVS